MAQVGVSLGDELHSASYSDILLVARGREIKEQNW